MSPATGDATREQFERRMRARRAATCVRAARQAIAEGRMLDAEERLDEACRLDPDDTEARLLLEELQTERAAIDTDAAGATVEVRGDGWSHWLAAAVAILALAALAFFWPPAGDSHRGETPARRAPASPVNDGLPADARATETGEPAEAPEQAAGMAVQSPVGTSGTSSGHVARAVDGANTGRVDVNSRPAPKSDEASPAPAASALEHRPSEETRQASMARPAAPDPSARPPASQVTAPESAAAPDVATDAAATAAASPAIERPAEPASHAADPAARVAPAPRELPRPAEPTLRADTPRDGALSSVPGATADPALASLRPAPGPSDDDLIRATLGRYAEAYARLDVAAARQVWPTVDVEALRRAFDGLASQGLTFERCEVRVIGLDATAACRGRAEYVPKVGSREPFSVSRLWVFSLRKGEGGWAIRSADAR